MAQNLIDRWNALSERKKDGVCLFVLLAFCLVLFGKTFFLGEQITRIARLPQDDYLFRALPGAAAISFDHAAYWMKIANYLLAGSLWREGIVPLWNPFSGCGTPFLAEVQAIVLSPVMVLFALWPSLEMHNFIMALQQVVGTFGLFLVARALGLSRYASIYAAVAMLLCGHQLWRSELQMNYYFYPISLFCFIRLAQTKHFLWAFAAGLGCAAIITSGDAQVSLLSITVASAFFVFICLLDCAKVSPFYFRVRDAFLWLAAAGLNTFCLCAPVFLSFAEYINAGDLSKRHEYYSSGSPATWESLLYMMLHPGFGGASTFLGCFCVPLVCLSLFALKSRRPYYLSVLASTIFAFMSTTRLEPFPFFDRLLGIKGLSAFEGIEPFALQLCLLTAFGLEELVSKTSLLNKGRYLVFLSACIAVAALPPLLVLQGFDLSKVNFDSMIKDIGLQSKLWQTDLAFLLLMLALISCRSFFKKNAILILAMAVISLNTASQLRATRTSLPVNPTFAYTQFEPLKFLQEHNDKRVIPVGYNLLHPNTNYIYRIYGLASHGPVRPLRLAQFTMACGGTADSFNDVFPKATFSKLIDLANVGYVASYLPVRDPQDKYNQEQKFDQSPVKFKGAKGLVINTATIRYDAATQEFGGFIDWKIEPGTGENFGYRTVLCDGDGNAVWSGGPFYVRQREFFKTDTRPPDASHVDVEGPVIASLPVGSQFTVAIYAITSEGQQLLSPETEQKGTDKNLIKLATFKKMTTPLPEDRRFNVVLETAGKVVRVYENRRVMPSAFIAHETVFAENEVKALEEISKQSFDPRRTVIIEDRAMELPKGQSSLSGQAEQATFSRPDINTISIDVKAASKGLLVISDQYYPGWHATVDGVDVPLARADFLFKALPIEPGNHKVLLYFRPTYLIPGLVLMAICLVLNAGLLCIGRAKRRKEHSNQSSDSDPVLNKVS